MYKNMPDISISFTSNIPAEVFVDFTKAIQAEGLNLQIQERDTEGPFNILEWMVPTAAIVCIAKPYFDGFLGKMGEDHYEILRKGIGRLWAKFFGGDRVVPQRRIAQSGGNILRTEYTLSFSILTQSKDGRLIKLMLKEEISQQEYQDATDTFLTFIEGHHKGVEGTEIPKQFCSVGIDDRLFVTYDAVKKEIQFLDILPEHIRKELIDKKSIHRTL